MNKSNEEILEELYYEVSQMFIAGLSEESIFKNLYDRNLVEEIVQTIINLAKENIIKTANTIQGNIDNTEEVAKVIDGINKSEKHSIIDTRELEKSISIENLLKSIDTDCVVFYDSERILTDGVVGENKDIHKRKYAWKRTYQIEGNNVEKKAGMMLFLGKQEHDGFDYIEINMKDADDNLVGKTVLPDGNTILSKISPDLKFLGSIEGNVNDAENGAASFISRHPNETTQKKSEGEVRQDGIGRNSPCSCGSGERYKHCCGKM